MIFLLRTIFVFTLLFQCFMINGLTRNVPVQQQQTAIYRSYTNHVDVLRKTTIIQKRPRNNNVYLFNSQQLYDLDRNYMDDRKIIQIVEPKKRTIKAFDQQTPHSGRHFIPSHPNYNNKHKNIIQRLLISLLPSSWGKNRRFTEGWYYRLTIPQSNVSFAFIFSIEDATVTKSNIKLACVQVIGPNDEYIIQADNKVTKFWAWKHQQAFGYIFSFKDNNNITSSMNYDREHLTAIQNDHWYQIVESGFQILPTSFVGKIRGHDGTRKGGIVLHGQEVDIVERYECDFDFTINPICGWGGNTSTAQKSTAGWLSSYPIFEPHWQITLSDARATGTVRWKNDTYNFTNVPFHAEKNWGASLPKKWYWTQCNSFDGYDDEQLSVIAGGGIRDIPFFKKTETIGMVTVHYRNKMYEAVPWLGGMDWDVSTWGYWKLSGNNTFTDEPFEVEVVYKIDDPITKPGLVFRSPTPNDGMVRFCRDTFEAKVTLNLWSLVWIEQEQEFVRGDKIIDNATSRQGGAEIGGSPWWDDWTGEAKLKRPVKALLRMPYKFQKMKQSIRKQFARQS